MWYVVAINFWFKTEKNDPLNLCWLGTWVSFLLQLVPNSYTWTASQRGRPHPPGTLKDKFSGIMWLNQSLADTQLCPQHCISVWWKFRNKYMKTEKSRAWKTEQHIWTQQYQAIKHFREGGKSYIKSCARPCEGWSHFLFKRDVWQFGSFSRTCRWKKRVLNNGCGLKIAWCDLSTEWRKAFRNASFKTWLKT